MKQVDLHVHSTYSDGTNTPAELIAIASSKNLSAIALTDHDTLDGIPDALKAAGNSEVELIPGVELSTNFNNTEVHIVGLFIDYTNNAINDYLKTQRESRINRNISICERFSSIGINITYEQMLKLYPDAVITRAHFADYLVKNNYTGDRNEAFDRYLSPGKPCFVNRHKVDPSEAVNIIHQAGGVAVLAHPILYHLGKTQMMSLLTMYAVPQLMESKLFIQLINPPMKGKSAKLPKSIIFSYPAALITTVITNLTYS